MTRTARRGSTGRSLPATPWGYLKRRFGSRYRTLEDKDEECLCDDVTPEDPANPEDTNCDEVPGAKKNKSDLKETHKAKLTGSSMKKLFQNIKQKLSGRKLRRQLKQAEMTPLLDESDTSSKGKKLPRSKRIKRRGKSKKVKEEKIQLLEEKEEDCGSDDGVDGDINNDRGSSFEGEGTCGVRWRRNKTKKTLEFDDDSEVVEFVDERRMKRIEARRRRRQKGKLCFNCRQTGHMIHECPQVESAETGICFKCGAGDHTSKNCKAAKVASNEYPYAKCFICDEVGHLSRSCPHNPRGMYPQGGGCKVCGSVEHLKANCPERMGNTNQYESWGGASLVIGNNSVDAEDYSMEVTPAASANTTHTQSRKVVHF